MMNRLFPRFNDYQQNYNGYSTNPMSSRRAVEERQRLSEMNRYSQWRQKKQLRRQQLEVQRQAEEEERRRQEQESQRQDEEEERRRQRLQRQSPAYTVVRGPDGRLYRVPVEQDRDDQASERRVASDLKRQRQSQPRYVRSSDGRMYEVRPRPTVDENEKENKVQKQPTTPVTKSFSDSVAKGNDRVKVEVSPQEKDDVTQVKISLRNDRKKDTTAANGSRRRRVTVIVEDVPESEIEDETKSIWRNRRPGPGESWMEPIAE
ncbi:expressed unknown protein [Seminavis robusta]|uniref:Uncharacterized protein n=1 Tax=Seminavis robusta TaxID=568900 RepID=A0A9N8DM16_9STRA|nr:expressed unknown protein [Seminavis robusta]|eukprot:Sro200_g084750.1 n/a (262) ;mRNA; f:49401-50186